MMSVTVRRIGNEQMMTKIYGENTNLLWKWEPPSFWSQTWTPTSHILRNTSLGPHEVSKWTQCGKFWFSVHNNKAMQSCTQFFLLKKFRQHIRYSVMTDILLAGWQSNTCWHHNRMMTDPQTCKYYQKELHSQNEKFYLLLERCIRDEHKPPRLSWELLLDLSS